MLGLQILIDGFAISSLYAIGAMGFTLIFGVSGVLNLSHGGIMAIAAVIGWLAAGDLGLGTYLGTLVGVIAGSFVRSSNYCVTRTATTLASNTCTFKIPMSVVGSKNMLKALPK